MSIKNKSKKEDNYKSGKITFICSGYNFNIIKSPESFYNSDEFRKIKNRKKTKKI